MGMSSTVLWKRLFQSLILFLVLSISAQSAFAICGDGTLDPNEQCDDGRLDDGDGCSAGCLIENPSGCADDQREGFTDISSYPRISGCGGGWSEPGSRSISACNGQGGDDGANPTGAGCAAADLCATGWHVCGTVQDVQTSLGATGTCNDATQNNDPNLYFASQVSGPGSGRCSNNPQHLNDNFGCGNVGATPNSATCSPLNRFSNNLCGSLPANDGWTCAGASSVTEQTRIRKTQPQGGGVMCCFGPGLQITITNPGTFTNTDRPTVTGTTDAADGTTISVVFPDQSSATTLAAGGAWTILWPPTAAALPEGTTQTITASAYSTETGFSGTRQDTTYVLCGNGNTNGVEQCDDDNTTNGDGCDEFCQFEICGNSQVQANEQCDDGNTTGGDGCSQSCQTEPDYTCPTDGGQCLTVAITSPANNSFHPAEPAYSGTATENTQVALVFRNNLGVIVSNANVISDGNGDWTGSPQNLTDGTYTLEASVTTNGGTITKTVTFTIDTVAPNVDILVPTDNTITNDNTVAITGTTDIDASVVIEVVDQNGTIVQTLATTNLNGVFEATTLPLADGTYTITATATDPAGNMATDGPVRITVDTVTQVNIDAPTDGTITNDNTPNITGTAEVDANVVLEIRNDLGVVVETLSPTNNNGSFDVDASTLPDGTYTITATATDAAGNTATDGPVRITVDTVTQVAITTPADNSTTNDTTPTLSGTAEAGASIEIQLIDANNTTVLTQTVVADASGNWTHTPTTALAGDTFTMEVTATDVAGNTATDSHTFTVDAGTAVSIATPVDNSTTNDNTPNITGRAEVDAQLSVEIRNTSGVIVETLAPQNNNGSFDVDAAALPDGTYTVAVTATDTAGNVATDTHTFTVDTVTNVTIITPINNSTTNDTTPNISGTTEPGATVSIEIRNGLGDLVETLTPQNNAGAFSVDTSALPDGTYTVTATATDAAGNTATDGPVTFNVDTGTEVAITAPTDNSITSNPRPDLVGTAERLSSVSISVQDAAGTTVIQQTVQSDANGDWTHTPVNDLIDGTYTITATVTDAAGNTATDTHTFTVDTVTNVAITLPVTNTITNDTTPNITGTAEVDANIVIEIRNDLGVVVETLSPTNNNGGFDVDAAALPDGVYTITATATDAAGNTDTDGPVAITIDTVTNVEITAPSDASVTSNTKPDIQGTGEANASIEIVVTDNAGNDVLTQTVTADANGNWTHSPANALVDGDYTVTVTSEDAVGNTATDTHTFTIDTTALPIDITTPVAGTQTNDNTPDVLGTTQANTDVTLTITNTNGDVVETLTITSDANGDWTSTLAQLVDGDYIATATVTNTAGTVSTATTNFTVDTIAPNLTLDTPVDGAQTNNNILTLNGTGEANPVTLTITDANGTIVDTLTVTPDAAGNYTIDTGMLADGTYTIDATSTDAAGNVATAGPNTVTIDTTGPDITITTPVNDAVIGDNTPDVTGTTEPNAMVTITITNTNGDVVFTGQTTTDANGDWSVNVDPALADGEHTITATTQDAVGNESSTTSTFTVDATAPILTIKTPSDMDTTMDTTPTITGTSEPGATIDILINGESVGTTTADANGDWTFDLPDDKALEEGDSTIEATTTDGAGNATTAGPITITVEAEPKDPVTITSPTDGGTVSGPDITITGTGEPGEEITVTVNGKDVTVIVDEDGNWSTTVNDVPDGDYTINAKNGDREANVTVTVEMADSTEYLLQGRSCSSTNATPVGLLPIWCVMGLALIRVRRRRLRA